MHTLAATLYQGMAVVKRLGKSIHSNAVFFLDDSGNTGVDILDVGQPLFALASTAGSTAETMEFRF